MTEVNTGSESTRLHVPVPTVHLGTGWPIHNNIAVFLFLNIRIRLTPKIFLPAFSILIKCAAI